jgi:hypothetical protein
MRFSEHEQPHEWLRALHESGSGYTQLLNESGDPIVAGYRVASARCRASARSTRVPTLREVRAALLELSRRIQGFSASHLSMARIQSDCERAGLLVISPRILEAA